MTSTFRRIIITAILFIAVAGIAVALVMSGGCSRVAKDPIEGMKNGAVNVVLNSSGIKGKVDAELRTRANAIAGEMGIPESVVNTMVDSLAIEDWEATSLPDNAQPTGTYEFNVEGTPTRVTTYEDPSIVTIDVYGQPVTMAVPESARNYVPLIGYAQYLQ